MYSAVRLFAFVFNALLLIVAYQIVDDVPACYRGARCRTRAVAVAMSIAAPIATLSLLWLQIRGAAARDFVALFLKRRELAMRRAILEDEKRIVELTTTDKG